MQNFSDVVDLSVLVPTDHGYIDDETTYMSIKCDAMNDDIGKVPVLGRIVYDIKLTEHPLCLSTWDIAWDVTVARVIRLLHLPDVLSEYVGRRKTSTYVNMARWWAATFHTMSNDAALRLFDTMLRYTYHTDDMKRIKSCPYTVVDAGDLTFAPVCDFGDGLTRDMSRMSPRDGIPLVTIPYSLITYHMGLLDRATPQSELPMSAYVAGAVDMKYASTADYNVVRGPIRIPSIDLLAANGFIGVPHDSDGTAVIRTDHRRRPALLAHTGCHLCERACGACVRCGRRDLLFCKQHSEHVSTCTCVRQHRNGLSILNA